MPNNKQNKNSLTRDELLKIRRDLWDTLTYGFKVPIFCKDVSPGVNFSYPMYPDRKTARPSSELPIYVGDSLGEATNKGIREDNEKKEKPLEIKEFKLDDLLNTPLTWVIKLNENIIAIDIDVKNGKDGYKFWTETILKKYDLDPNEARWICRTKSGGYRYLFDIRGYSPADREFFNQYKMDFYLRDENNKPLIEDNRGVDAGVEVLGFNHLCNICSYSNDGYDLNPAFNDIQDSLNIPELPTEWYEMMVKENNLGLSGKSQTKPKTKTKQKKLPKPTPKTIEPSEPSEPSEPAQDSDNSNIIDDEKLIFYLERISPNISNEAWSKILYIIDHTYRSNWPFHKEIDKKIIDIKIKWSRGDYNLKGEKYQKFGSNAINIIKSNTKKCSEKHEDMDEGKKLTLRSLPDMYPNIEKEYLIKSNKKPKELSKTEEECKVWSEECKVWSVECKVWSVE